MLEVKNLQVNLSYLMKDGKFYASPLTFDSIDKYSRIDYTFRHSKDNRETKRVKPTNFSLGHVYELGLLKEGKFQPEFLIF